MHSQVKVNFTPRKPIASPSTSIYNIKGDFTLIGNIPSPVSIEEKTVMHDFKIKAPATPIRFIRVSAKNNLCPKGHSGEGKPGWIFADELVVE